MAGRGSVGRTKRRRRRRRRGGCRCENKEMGMEDSMERSKVRSIHIGCSQRGEGVLQKHTYKYGA